VTIDPYSHVPRYLQLAALLRARIESGELGPGDRLPSQPTLVQEYGVAKMTAAKALRVLVDEGLAVTVPGMGTFVKPKG
jgi:DNA-binding GntR family transcriptional regulator